VDVLATYRDPDGRVETTQLILQNALILAVNIGQTEPTTPEGAKTSMTLAVAPEDTERLTAAAVAGQVRVSLRSPGDTTVINTPGVTVRDIQFGRQEDMIGSSPVKTSGTSPSSTASDKGKPWEITIIRGTEVKKEMM